MGARPIALMDALCFGDPGHPRTGYLLGGVVGGIGFYGNCVGVPTVGGSVTFDACYNGNPLVNALCLGIADRDRIFTARAQGPGNPVLLVGSATGRDGIAGASFASVELGAETEERRPAVQVGNPFLEKLLIEACLELVGHPDVVAMQDLGAAGLTGASSEMAAHGGCGIEIDVAAVSRREAGMTPFEVMLSESQERMLIVVRAGAEQDVRAVFDRWGLHSDLIGRVTDDGLVRIHDGANLVAELPAGYLSGGTPEYQPPVMQPSKPTLRSEVPFSVPDDLGAVLLDLLASPNLCSRRSLFEQYDHMVQINTIVPPGEGSAVLRVKGTPSGLVLGLGSNPRVCAADPYTGGALAVAEACRNVSCAGARPIALTDCLNFGDPERVGVWQALTAVIEGIREACVVLDVPIISGNVSLYNETEGAPIDPTPVVGALGLLEDVTKHARAAFEPNQEVWLLGPLAAELGASEYAAWSGWKSGAPAALDLDLERRVQACVRELVESGLVTTATDVADGGLAVALAELALAGNVGIEADLAAEWGSIRPDAALFGEAGSRIIVGFDPAYRTRVDTIARQHGVPTTRLGATGGKRITIGDWLAVDIDEARQRWSGALDRIGAAQGPGGAHGDS
jgi:phosphoribosylformylglycinamidine synthase